MITQEAFEASEELIHELRQAVSETAFDRMTRLLFSTDASIYQMMPVGVVFPRDADEAAAAVEIAGKHGVPILPRGGGSSLAGQAVGHALIVDFSRHMDRVIDINAEAQTARAQPGVTLGALNRAAGKYGLMFGPDPASGDRATMGGVLGNNATGAHSIVYGMAVDHVLSLDTILSDGSRTTFDALNGDSWADRAKRPGLEGQIYRAVAGILERYADQIATRYPHTFRTVAGYGLNQLVGVDSPNLAKLLVGSEGTLGVMTEAVLNLVPMPKVKRLALVHFSEVRAALESVPELLKTDPSAVEMLDKMMLDLTRDKTEYRHLLTYIEGDPAIVLFVEYTGDGEAELDAGIGRLKATLNRINHHDPLVILSDPAQQADVWSVRVVGLGILMSIRGDTKPLPFIEDAAVPVEHLADYITRIHEIAYQAGVERVAMYAHASAGCIHVRPMVNLKTKDGIRQIREIGQGALELCIKYKGTISGEHGQGIARSEFGERLFGPEMMQAFREVKSTFDPKGIMNPGKIIDAPSMNDESLLRFGSDYRTPHEPNVTVMSFDSDGGFARSVEMCNGAGVCRKLDQGVMCPSYMITRDEVHSSRGRANALRAAMMGLLGPDGMTSRELYEVFDLCIACKACKSECPSAVDVAKMRGEFLQLYYDKHGTPLRSRIFANIASLDRLGQPVWPLANLMMVGPVKWVMMGMGVHPKRSLPKLAPQTFTRWYGKHRAEVDGKRPAIQGQTVVLFVDTFMQHNEPNIGQATIKVLESGGYEVIVVQRDDGRPAVSKGQLRMAAKLARENVAVLAPYAKQGIAIVGCEPSAMAMLVDEYPHMVQGDQAHVVAEQAMLIEQFIVREVEAGRLNLRFDETPREVLLHGHCNQKALFGTQSTHQMLGLIPNCTVEEIESSCCGMAGSFGYEKEHYDISIQMAERSLAPAVRAASADTIICAPGTSCRDQIEHTAQRQGLHSIEVLAGALVGE
jgi:FAD/FMN-containing dehydrogenase/Fe-S oxidoreductase